MLTIAGGIVLGFIALCALPFVLALAWLVAPYVIGLIGLVVVGAGIWAMEFNHTPISDLWGPLIVGGLLCAWFNIWNELRQQNGLFFDR
jgi:hypothetical protein